MARLISLLLGLLALLLGPLPAVAAAPPAMATAVTALIEHCEETGAAVDDEEDDDADRTAEHPCCKNSMGSCCQVAVPLAGPATSHISGRSRHAHGASAEIFTLGTSGPPLTEPPTFA